MASISYHYLGIINTLASPYPIPAPKMNLSPLYKIICRHYMCRWIIHEGSWRVSATSESWRRQSWQTRVGQAALGKENGGFAEKVLVWKWCTAPCARREAWLLTRARGQLGWRCRIISFSIELSWLVEVKWFRSRCVWDFTQLNPLGQKQPFLYDGNMRNVT